MADEVQAWTVQRLLGWTTAFFTRKEVDPPRLSAELLLAHVLRVPRIKLYTDFERLVGETELKSYRELVRRASEQEPIAYLTGTAHFFNLEFLVTRDVLIPRPDTETLVENILQLARRTTGFESPRVLDLCTGSGCIAIALAHHQKHLRAVAVEFSSAAFAVAQQNVAKHSIAERVELLQGDLFEPLQQLVDRTAFDLIVGNPPYIPTATIATLDRSVREYEPLAALDGGADGLSLHRRIFADAPKWLRSGGRMLLEIGFDQAEPARTLAGEFSEFTDTQILKDHAGNDRVISVVRR